ncbi:MAG: hypothetical protein ACK2UY_14025 [Anaerolineae bacterium]|jgi:hypothetical protein
MTEPYGQSPSGDGPLYFNGIDGLSGEYLLPPMTSERLARLIRRRAEPEDRRALLGRLGAERGLTEEEQREQEEEQTINGWELKDKARRQSQMGAFPLKEGLDPADLAQAGWAVVLPQARDEAHARHLAEIQHALKPLLDLRREQAGDERFRIFQGESGYRWEERKDQFFKRQAPEIRGGPADPTQMPFYVLLIGGPGEIPFEFQFQLDVMRGVGRLDLGHDYEAYHRYASGVVAAARGEIRLPRRAAFFGTANPGDSATQTSARWLVQPLYENLQETAPAGEIPLRHPWQLEAFLGEGQATRARLEALLGGDGKQAPALLFAAGHGMAFPAGHPRQMAEQGALVCQDWGGPGTEPAPGHYLAGQNLPGDAAVQGMVAVLFACFGAGTPQYDHFAQEAFETLAPLAPQGFTGALPQRLLSLGALAIIGHVERAWGYSFVSPGGRLDNQAFVTALRKLLNGDRVGLATDSSFDLRYADMSDGLRMALEGLWRRPDSVSSEELAHMWTAANDARNYVVLGDPAVTLPVSETA